MLDLLAEKNCLSVRSNDFDLKTKSPIQANFNLYSFNNFYNTELRNDFIYEIKVHYVKCFVL